MPVLSASCVPLLHDLQCATMHTAKRQMPGESSLVQLFPSPCLSPLPYHSQQNQHCSSRGFSGAVFRGQGVEPRLSRRHAVIANLNLFPPPFALSPSLLDIPCLAALMPTIPFKSRIFRKQAPLTNRCCCVSVLFAPLSRLPRLTTFREYPLAYTTENGEQGAPFASSCPCGR